MDNQHAVLFFVPTLVPPDDVKGLVVALDRLMDNQELCESYAARAVEVQERFSLKRIADMWEEVFQELSR